MNTNTAQILNVSVHIHNKIQPHLADVLIGSLSGGAWLLELEMMFQVWLKSVASVMTSQ